MGESKRKSRNHANILAREPRCIYCANAPASIEHMPPISMFTSRRRPSGLEFACCDDCNKGTSAADLVASFLARITQGYSTEHILIVEAAERRGKLAQLAPGFLEEFFRRDKTRQVSRRDKLGIIKPYIEIHADGPLTKAYLTVFAAKLGMAYYREHIGHALPMTGGVLTSYFLNAGLSEAAGDAILEKLPIFHTVVQGRFVVPQQFAYRFNYDGKSVVAALTGFHSNLHILTVASTDPRYSELMKNFPTADYVQPGELVSRVPQRIKRPESAA
jgi:hypothetical protein